MKHTQAVGLILLNGLMILSYYLVQQDFIARQEYWLSLGFTPAVSYSFLTYTLTATRGGVFIPGLLTLDWSQLALLVAIVVDAAVVMTRLMARRSDGRGTPRAPKAA